MPPWRADGRGERMPRPSHLASLILTLAALAALAAAAPASAAVHRVPGTALASGATRFDLGGIPVRAVVRAHVTLASGRHVALRLRRLRAGTRTGVVRLRLPRAGRALLVLRVDRRPPAAPRRAARATCGPIPCSARQRAPAYSPSLPISRATKRSISSRHKQ